MIVMTSRRMAVQSERWTASRCTDLTVLTLQTSPRHAAAHVDGDPEQRRLERFPGISPMQILERPQEHVLRDVARVVSTAQQPRRQSHHAAFVADDDLLERRCVTPEGQADEPRDSVFRPTALLSLSAVCISREPSGLTSMHPSR
jgi:hypothetical protein